MLEKSRIKIGRHVVDIRSNFVSGRQPLLLIHGVGVSGTYFVPFAEELAKKYAVYVVDLPGYGKTPRPPRPLTISELATVVKSITIFYGLEKAVLIGQSMGCQTVAQLGKMNPDLYKKMILIGPTVNQKERNILMQSFRLLQDTFHEPFKLNMIILTDYIRMGVTRYFKTSKFMVNDSIEKNLSKITIPILVVRGGNDKIVPREWITFLTTFAPNIRIKEIADAPHNVQYTNVNELAKLCIRFIDTQNKL